MNVSFPVEINSFGPTSPWRYLNGHTRQTFTWSAVLRAAMMAGYPRLTSLPSRQFARWRAAAIRLALRRSRGSLIQPPECNQFDPSERGAVNSLLGVVVTKLLVERLLNAPIFLFLDVHFQLDYPASGDRTRPDFAAMTVAEEWFSVESKGRSRFRQATVHKGKSQARALGTVNGQNVQTGVVCLTSFRARQMEARFSDPLPTRGKLLNARITLPQVLRAYYGQFERFQKFSERMGESDVRGYYRPVTLWRSSELDIDFGVVPELETALRTQSTERPLAVLRDLTGSQSGSQASDVGSDGIVVIPGESWREEP